MTQTADTLRGVGVRHELARELFGDRMLDESAHQRVFGLETSEHNRSPILFPAQLLEKMAAFGAFLMFVPPGLSLKVIMEKTGNRTVDGFPIFNSYDWITGRWSIGPKEEKSGIPEEFYVESMKPGWRLVTTDVIDDKRQRHYVGTTSVLKSFAVEMFSGLRMPEQFQSAVKQFDGLETGMSTALEKAFQKRDNLTLISIAKDLVDLKINQMCRETPAEVVLSHVLWSNIATRPIMGRFVHTNRLCRNGSIVRTGFFNVIPKGGGSINGTHAHYHDQATGVRFRLHEDLFKKE